MSQSKSFLKEEFKSIKNKIKKQTLILCKSETNQIFGGVLRKNLNPNDPKNILFSITNETIHKYVDNKDNNEIPFLSEEYTSSSDEDDESCEISNAEEENINDQKYIEKNIDPIIRFGNLDLIIGDDCGNKATCFSKIGDKYKRKIGYQGEYHLAGQKVFKLSNCVIFSIKSIK